MTTTSLRRTLLSVGLAAAVLAPGRASAVTQSYCSFPSPLTTWTLNQNAFEALGSEIRLTDAVANETGSAWLTTPVAITATTSFHFYFTFQIGPNAPGGEGLAFVLHNDPAGAAALGGGVAQMGYGGITPSVIVEFDTIKNSANDLASNHVGLMLNGSNTVHTASATPGFTMANGGVLSAWVDYDGNAKTVSVYLAKTNVKPGAALFTHALNLYTQLGSAGQMYVGFTAATGASPQLNEHDVYELEFSSTGIPCQCEGDAFCSGATPACGASGICTICSATNHTACTGATPTCDVPVNTCVGCLTNADCGGGKPICDSMSLTCRACTTNADCGGNTPVCAMTGPSAGTCVVCTTDANCPPTMQRCAPTNTCVQCLSASDCGGDTPICNAGTCRPCASDADCGGATPACEVWGACGQCSPTNASACHGGTSVCDFPTGTCVACEFNTDCGGSTPTCDTTTHTCRPCMANADCVNNPSGPACATSGMKAGTCVLCAANGDCTSPATPVCDTVSNTCVACLTNADCMAPTPVCNAQDLCVQCLTSSDCSGATPVCDPVSSQCQPCANDYAAQNPGPLSCPTAALPACQIAGSPLAGQCGVCSSIDDMLCVTQPATPVCVTSSATCGCNADTDCMPDSYCDTSAAATGTCTPGCRVMNGLDNCATGKYCTKQDGTVGACMAEPCNQNSDCAAPNPVCDTIVQPHVCVACLNDTDCAMGLVCDTMSHCVECTSQKTGNCSAAQTGARCLASETCGCATDADCGGATSGRVCDPTQHTCTTGCRGSGGNGCPPPMVCSSSDGMIGKCETSMATSSSTSSSTGAGGADGGPGGGGAGGGATAHAVSQSVGCGCRVGAEDEGARGGLAALAAAIALVRRRRRSTQSSPNGERTVRG
jgi:MYXO-CTERM domain-containing protein